MKRDGRTLVSARLVGMIMLLLTPLMLSRSVAQGATLACTSATTLEALVSCITRQMPSEGSDGFVVPSGEDQQAWRTVVTHMVDGRCTDIALPDSLRTAYAIRAVTDATDQRTYCVLLEVADANGNGMVDRGWGTVMVNSRAVRELSIQIAHPKSEVGTETQGVGVFKGTGAHTFLMAGAHRAANATPSTCQSGHAQADAAHNTATLFQPAVEAVLQSATSSGRGVTALQFHGMATTSCPDVDVYITHGRAVPPVPDTIRTLQSNLKARNATWRVVVPGDAVLCNLHGSTNVQGRLLNNVPAANVCTMAASSASGRFVSIEQKPNFRNAANWVAAINATWPAAQVLCDGQIVDGTTNPNGRLVLRSDKSNAVIRNCTFRNFTDEAIIIDGATDVLIENNRFENIRSRVVGQDTHAIAVPTRAQRITIRSNTFVDIGADGVQLGDTGTDIRDVTISHNEFFVTSDTVGENGVDIKTVQGPVRIANNRIHGFRPCESDQDCSGDPHGAGIVIHAGATNVLVERNLIYNNTRGLSIAAGATNLPPRNVVVRNNVIYNNQRRAVAIDKVHSIKLLNNTLVNNPEGMVISNTPMADGACANANNLVAGTGTVSSACTPQRNLHYATISDAKFVNPAADDFHLQSISPAVNQGVTLADVPDDMDAQARPGGAAYDVGADEVVAQAPGQLTVVTALTFSPANGVVGQSVEARYTVQNTGGQAITATWLLVGARDPNNANVDFPGAANVTLQPGQHYTYRLSRSFGAAGNYTAWPAALVNGSWIELAPRTTFEVQQVASGCTPAYGSFGPGVWPPACWRPYAATSPFNTALPPNPHIAANSSAIVARVLGDVSQQDRPNHLTAHVGGTSGEPTYYTQATDPEYTLQCTMTIWGNCPLNGTKIRIPRGAQVEGGRPAAITNNELKYMDEPDAHLTVVDQATGWEYDLWQVHRSPIRPEDGSVLQFSWGGRTRIDGNGLAFDAQGDATAARFGSLAGRVRAEELAARQINHALFVVINCDSGTHVYPARKSGQSCDDIGLSTTNAPPMGTRLQLNMTVAEIDALPIRTWKKTLLHAMAKYGMFFGDTGSQGLFSIETEAGNQYTSLGAYPDAWWEFAKRVEVETGKQEWETYDPPGDAPLEYVGKLYNRPDDPNPNFDWMANVWSRLRVIDPCVSQGTCS